MSEDSFTIESLAEYLHLNPARVRRLADRGRLPGRKVGGVWRFSQGEIHHWLEEEIGASDEVELAQMEEVLERADSCASDEAISVAAILPMEAIAVPLPARTRNSVIDCMVDLAARTGWLWDPPKMAALVRSREDMHPTALENGVALLHPRRPAPALLDRAFLALGRTDQGIPFGSTRGILTDIFLLICSVDDRGHLRVLARLSRLIADPNFTSALREAPDAAAAHEMVRHYEQKLT